MQHRYEPDPFSRHPAAARVGRVLAALGVAGLFAAAWATAGPGNGWQAPRDQVAVTLPAVTVIGYRAALTADGISAVACERQGTDGSRRAV